MRLWVHECQRVLGDRLVSEADQAKFGEFQAATIRKFFGDLRLVGGKIYGCVVSSELVLGCGKWRGPLGPPALLSAASQQEDIEAAPLLFNSFMARDGSEMPVYTCAPSVDALKRALEDKLAEYNENNPGGQRQGLV